MSISSQSFDAADEPLIRNYIAKRYAVKSDPPCLFLEYEDDNHRRRVRAVSVKQTHRRSHQINNCMYVSLVLLKCNARNSWGCGSDVSFICTCEGVAAVAMRH